eukprot:scaffold62057_cov13-Tisochrysis_lutea.AAC.1
MKSMSSVAMIKAFNLRTARISSNWTLMSWLFAWLCPTAGLEPGCSAGMLGSCIFQSGQGFGVGTE